MSYRCPETPSTLWPAQENQQLLIFMVVLNSLSLILGSFTVLLQLLIKKIHSIKTMSFYFCASTTMTHFWILFGPMVGMDNLRSHNSFLCALQGAFLGFSVFSSVIWFCWISIQLYTVMVLDQHKISHVWAHISSWGIPIAITIIDLSLPGMAFRELWCWVPTCQKGLWEWLFYAPALLILLIVALLWTRSLILVLQVSKKMETRAFMIQNFLGVFIFFVSYTFQGAHRLYLILQSPSWLLEMIHVITISWMGVVCFFVFGITPHNIDSLKAKFCKSVKHVIQEY